MGLDDAVRLLLRRCDPDERDVVARLIRFPEWPLWLRELGLGVALGLIVVLSILVWAEHRDSITREHRQICAIERYIETRFRIDKQLTTTPPGVFDQRLAAIRLMERQIGIGKCDTEGATR